MSKITAYNPLTSPQSDDLLVIVDVHDTTMAPTGTDKKLTVANLLAAANAYTPASANGDGTQRILVPSYFYPTTHVADWNSIRASAPYAAIAVVNPSSGPGASSDPNWVTQVQQAQASGVRMLGYVHTSYTAVSLATIESQIDSYYNWYGVDGIFIDEVTQDTGAHQSYYASLYAYVKAKASGQRIVVINPGAVPDQSYMNCCDIACIAEDPLSTYTSSWTPPSWGTSYPASRFLHIVSGVTSTASLMQTLALTRANRAGYVYVTDDGSYTTLAGDTTGLGYWQQEVAWAADSESALSVSWVNAVSRFGADPTGATDSTTAINAALAVGGTVYLPAGTYLISQTLLIGSNTILVGDGRGSTTIRVKASSLSGFTQVGANTGAPMIATTGNTAQSRIRIGPGLTFDGNQANAGTLPAFANGPETAPVSIWNSSEIRVEGIEVINAAGYSVYLQKCSGSMVAGNSITSGGGSALGTNQQDGVHLTGCTQAVVSGNIIDTGTGTAGDDGIAVQSLGSAATSHDITITGNVIRSAQSGIHVAMDGGSNYNITITGNAVWAAVIDAVTIDSSGSGTGTAITIDGNTFQNIPAAVNVSVACKGLVVTGNTCDTFTGSSQTGIYVIKSSDLTCSDNTLTTCTSLLKGIQVGDSSAGVAKFAVSGNTIDMSGAGSGAIGILARDSVTGSVTGNTAIGATNASSSGIRLDGAGTAPTGIAVTGNAVTAWATGIQETNSGTQPDYNTYVGNNCHGNTAFITTSGTHDVVASNVVA